MMKIVRLKRLLENTPKNSGFHMRVKPQSRHCTVSPLYNEVLSKFWNLIIGLRLIYSTDNYADVPL